MFITRRLLPVTWVLSAVLAPSAWAQRERRVDLMDTSVHRAGPPRNAGAAREAEAIRGMRAPSRRIMLRALDPAETRLPARKPGLTPIGVTRALPADVLSQGEWSTSPDGKRVWRVAVQSVGATSLRIHFADFHAGGGKVWLIGANGETAGPYTGEGLFADGDFWTDLISGESLIVAYEAAPGAPAEGEPPFRIVEISHQFQEALAAAPVAAAADGVVRPLAAAASCALDVTCYPDYNGPASAVAMMVFESGGGTYSCTGSLITSAAQPPLPFFVTANHCISTDGEARSLITYFKYQTAACNGEPPAQSAVPRVLGASYIAGQPIAGGDFSLLQLNAFPDTDVTVLGWYASVISDSEAVTGISHPRGDYKRIAFGQRTPDLAIRFTTGERMPASAGYQVEWTQGVTQAGSSGSPLLAQIDGKTYLVGTLSAGPNVDESDAAQVCAVRNLVASYGRFSVAAPSLMPFLSTSGGVSKPVIAPGGVVNAASYEPGIAPGAWISIFGQSLANVTRSVGAADLVDGRLPVSFAGVSVSINGKPGFIHYVSPSQINVQAPADGTEGTVAVTVTNSAGTSDPVAASERASLPAFFASDNFVAGVHLDGTVITGTGSARAGETISLYGTGFGATNPAIAPGLVGAFEARLTSTVEITIGGVPAPLSFAGLSAAGLDQFNITVPSLPSGVYQVIATLGGQRTKSGVYLRVRNTR